MAILYFRSGLGDVGGEPVLLLRGRAVIRDGDFGWNNEYLGRLLQRQRESWKKKVYIDMSRGLNTFWGSLLMDWYKIRVVIEIRPHRIFAWRSGDVDLGTRGLRGGLELDLPGLLGSTSSLFSLL